MLCFKLAGRDVTPCTVEEWGAWYGTEPTIVKEDSVNGVLIRTIFIGVDLRPKPTFPLKLFESMVYSGPMKGRTETYGTFGEAEQGHQNLVSEVLDTQQVA